LLLGLLALAGCSHTEDLAKASGPLFPLNPDHWQATPQELEAKRLEADEPGITKVNWGPDGSVPLD